MSVSAQPRIAKRVPCHVSIGHKRYSGMVLNVSKGGLFVQTAAVVRKGSSVGLDLRAAGTAESIPLDATVVWRRVVPHQLRSLSHGGMGVRIERADERYYGLLAEWLQVRHEDDAAARQPRSEPCVAESLRSSRHELLTYRVRVRAADSPRTRSVCVEASSLDAGDDWCVVDVEVV